MTRPIKQYPSKGEYPADEVVLACYEAVIDPDNEERCLQPERYAELSVTDLDTVPYWFGAHDEEADEVDEPDWWILMPLDCATKYPPHFEDEITKERKRQLDAFIAALNTEITQRVKTRSKLERELDELMEQIDKLEFDYEIKVATKNEGRVEFGRASALGLQLASPMEYTIEKHYIGSHFEILADLSDRDDAVRLLGELKCLLNPT